MVWLEVRVLPAPPRSLTRTEISRCRPNSAEYATDQSIAGFLYDEMGFHRGLAPEGNRFRLPKGGARGWEFPPLLELRSRWETLFGGDWDWHEREVVEWQKAQRRTLKW